MNEPYPQYVGHGTSPERANQITQKGFEQFEGHESVTGNIAYILEHWAVGIPTAGDRSRADALPLAESLLEQGKIAVSDPEDQAQLLTAARTYFATDEGRQAGGRILMFRPTALQPGYGLQTELEPTDGETGRAYRGYVGTWRGGRDQLGLYQATTPGEMRARRHELKEAGLTPSKRQRDRVTIPPEEIVAELLPTQRLRALFLQQLSQPLQETGRVSPEALIQELTAYLSDGQTDGTVALRLSDPAELRALAESMVRHTIRGIVIRTVRECWRVIADKQGVSVTDVRNKVRPLYSNERFVRSLAVLDQLAVDDPALERYGRLWAASFRRQLSELHHPSTTNAAASEEPSARTEFDVTDATG